MITECRNFSRRRECQGRSGEEEVEPRKTGGRENPTVQKGSGGHHLIAKRRCFDPSQSVGEGKDPSRHLSKDRKNDELRKRDWLKTKTANLTPADLEFHGGGMAFAPGTDHLDYLWLELTERENGQEFKGFRVVRLLQVKSIPVEARSDAGLLQKMRAILRGLGGAKVNLVYVAAGIFSDPPLGIVQCYGVAPSPRTKTKPCANPCVT